MDNEFTVLLAAWGNGDPAALEQLVPLVQRELHAVARRYMAQERPGHTLQATALVNEAWMRLIAGKAVNWHDRQHFARVCARLMRRILVDSARTRRSKRREHIEVPLLDDVAVLSKGNDNQLVLLDHALTQLEAIDPRMVRVVELRHFGGLTVEETAATLNIAPTTVHRDWKTAKAWLLRAMTAESSQHNVSI